MYANLGIDGYETLIFDASGVYFQFPAKNANWVKWIHLMIATFT